MPNTVILLNPDTLTFLTVDELKVVIHEVIAEDMETWRETIAIMTDRKLMKETREADEEAAGRSC